MRVSLAHISTGCNRVVNALSWSEDGLVAFAAHNTVVVYDVEAAAARAALLGHTNKVACVIWIPRHVVGTHAASEGTAYLASGGSDTNVIIWAVDTQNQCSWRKVATLGGAHTAAAGEPGVDGKPLDSQGHTGPVSSLAVHALPGGPAGSFLLVSTAGDGQVLVWKCSGLSADNSGVAGDQAAWRLVQAIPLAGNLTNCVDIIPIPDHPDWLLLALGCVDSCVRIMARAPDGHFTPACTLKGHENWITSVAFTSTVQENGSWQVWLATSSQDRNVRVWAIKPQQLAAKGGSAKTSIAFLTSFADKLTFLAAGLVLEASISAVLVGHEDWVHSVAWQPPVAGSGSAAAARKLPHLLSASMDRSMMIWEPELASGLFMCIESMGDAGADSLGYFGGAWSPDSQQLLAHGYTGALHLWTRRSPTAAPTGPIAGEATSVPQQQQQQQGRLVPAPAMTGHWDDVTDMTWGIDGQCLLTASADQTVRVWNQAAGGDQTAGGGGWYEMARPQVHGHNFASIASIARRDPWKFVFASASEEKVIRVLEAPVTFLHTLAAARGSQVPVALEGSAARPMGSTLAALGLSNKALYEGTDQSAGKDGQFEDGPDLAPRAAPAAVVGRPLEEHLSQSSLWPEVHKLYGHGNDVFALAACPAGSCLVSACKAQTADAAELIVWDARSPDFDAVQRLPAHNLTVTQLSFSPDGRFILSVSRDRSFCIWRALHDPVGDSAPSFELVGSTARAHDRIIWSGSWAPGARLLATGSRDKVLRIWTFNPDRPAAPDSAAVSLSNLPAAVTAVAFAPAHSRPAEGLDASCEGGAEVHLLAVGFESGHLRVLRVARDAAGTVTADEVWTAPPEMQHAAAVQAIKWQTTASASLYLATCSADHSLKIFTFQDL